MNRARSGVTIAYGTVCVVWGSTYLAIRIGVQDVPPGPFGGIRFLTAGLVLLLLALVLGHPLPTRLGDWCRAGAVGVMLLGIGAGSTYWAEQHVESSLAVIVISTSALQMAVIDALVPGGEARPSWRQWLALVIGLLGTVYLVRGEPVALGDAGWRGPIVLLGGTLSWSLGSIYSKRHPTQSSPYVVSALQMLFGGAALAIVGLSTGEAGRLAFSREGFGALLYLIIFGSLVAYTSYVYLLRHAPPAFVGTYFYVNTVVAVMLGWAILGEHVTWRTFLTMGVILGSVMWVRQENRALRTR